MLDEMSQNNPEAYKQFVQSNIQSGVKEIQKEKETKQKELSVKPSPQYVFKIYGNLIVSKIDDLEQKVSLQQNEITNEKFIIDKKTDKRVKFYFNILTSDRILMALDKDNNEVTDPTKYDCIPLSFSNLIIGKSASFGNAIYFYDVVVNDQVFAAMNKQLFQKVVLDTAIQRVKIDRNPLNFKFHKAHYEIDIKTIQMLKDKQYRTTVKYPKMEMILEAGADRLQIEMNRKKAQKPAEMDMSKLIEGLNLQQNNQPKPTRENKILIEEVSEKDIEIPYQLTHDLKQVNILISPLVDNFKDIDLQISAKQLILQTIKGSKLQLEFGCLVDDSNPSAKWDKKKKQLKIVLNKL